MARFASHAGATSLSDHQVLFDLLPLPAYVIDLKTLRFLAVNDAALVRYGYSRAAFLAMSGEQIRPAKERVRFRKAVRDSTTVAVVRGVWWHRTKGGEVFEVDIVSQRVIYQGRSARFVVAMDLSERRRMERLLKRSHEQLRRILARSRARREEDRTRIARELHDQLGQTLAALKIELSWLAGSIASREPWHLREKVASMTALVDETIGSVRRLSSELRPAVLDRLGLCAAIEWQAQDFERRTGILVRFESRIDDVDLNRGRSTGIFRVVNEAFTNVASHAQATEVLLGLHCRDGRLAVVLRDNGVGIPPRALVSDGSLGLIGMRERIEGLGGILKIRKGRPRGTVVSVTVPLTERRRAPRRESA